MCPRRLARIMHAIRPISVQAYALSEIVMLYARRSAWFQISVSWKLAQQVTCGVQLNAEHGTMTQLAASIDLSTFIRRHNDPTDDFHLNVH